jgi:hypothetical protein
LDLKQRNRYQRVNKSKRFWDHSIIQENGELEEIDCRDDSPLKAKAEALMKMLEQRKILVTEGHDQLRWGNNNEGTFNLKEAKGILLELDSHVPDKFGRTMEASRVDEDQTLHVVGSS